MTLPIIHARTTPTYYDGAMDSDTTESTLGKRLAKADDRVEELEAENDRLREALQKIAKPGRYVPPKRQRTIAENALDRAEDGEDG